MNRALSPCLCLCLAGCGGIQSSNGRDGVQSTLIGGLGDVFFWTSVAIYLIVASILILAIAKGRANRAREVNGDAASAASQEARWRRALIVWASASAVVVFGLSLATWWTDRSLARAEANPALEIEITAHQWWWEVRYSDPDSSRMLHTANELHLPVGRTARIVLKTGDVIHSLWIPNLGGKQDLIPGRRNDIALRPLRTGQFRSQCAEFCGMEHARMALDVSVETPAAFSAWYEAGLKAPPQPAGGTPLGGYALVQSLQCASCHTIAGTPASGTVGPDLSHLASRRSLAAGTLAMSPMNLRAWIADPQKVKPGANMPRVPLDASQLDAIVAYLETLK